MFAIQRQEYVHTPLDSSREHMGIFRVNDLALSSDFLRGRSFDQFEIKVSNRLVEAEQGFPPELRPNVALGFHKHKATACGFGLAMPAKDQGQSGSPSLGAGCGNEDAGIKK